MIKLANKRPPWNSLIAGLVLALACSTGRADIASPPKSGDAQLGAPLRWIAVAGTSDRFYLAQQSSDSRLILTPNEAFFPRGGLIAAGQGAVPDIDNLNGGKSFALIERWRSGDVAQWGLLFENTGQIQIRVWMTASQPSSKFALQSGKTKMSFSVRASSLEPVLVCERTITIDEPGKHELELICEQATGDNGLHWIEISGNAVRRAALLRKRWRPAAAHAKFTSSAAPDQVRIWVMEMDAVPGDLGFYCPITTPFGYFGPTWNADGRVNTGFNFSLWSFGRGKPQPPVEKLSHLLAIGNRDAAFGSFSHEGTGVKIRDWQPLQGRQSQRQALALRVEPGKYHDTYFSYFYAADQQRWHLFGVGNSYNKGKPLKSLWVGSFVEVPGPPHKQRSGVYEREMRYRGWIMDRSGHWYPLDQMSNGNIDKQTKLTHSDRGITDEGWFFLKTGGWEFRQPDDAPQIHLPQKHASRSPPAFMDPHKTKVLTTVASEIVPDAESLNRTADGLQGTFFVRGVAEDAEVVLYWGSREGLTLAERWEHQTTIGRVQEGENAFRIDNIAPAQTIFVRLLLRNSEGQFWSWQTVASPPLE